MSIYKRAKELASMGFFVFPIIENGKFPAVPDDFTGRATDDANDLARFWVDPVLGLEHNLNIGIATEKFHGGTALLVVDVDNKGEKKGSQVVKELQAKGFDFPTTLTQKTPTGGFHLIYSVKTAVKQGESVLGPGLDIRSKGGYILGAGSLINGVPYQMNNRPVVPAPDWIIQKCKESRKKEVRKKEPLKTVSQRAAKVRAKDYLLNQAPVAVEGAGGDQTTFRVAARLKDIGVNEDNALDLMLDHWNDNCSPPWGPDDLKQKIENAYAYGQNAVGADSPEAAFDKVDDSDMDDPIEELNKEFAFTIIGGRSAILRQMKNVETQYMTVQTFKDLLKASTIQTGNGKRKELTDLWLGSHKRKTYDYVELLPAKETPPNVFNLWQGFAIEPLKPDDAPTERQIEAVEMFKEHALENICMGKKDLYNWLMGYFAHLVQKPWQKPLTALVFRGKKGVGKNALINPIHSIFGDTHAMVTSEKRYLVGNFNKHFERLVFIVYDEAFWSGDKQAEGKLKDLITGRTHLIEQKGREMYKVKNLLRVCIIGNEEWVVPATEDERRFAVFNVGQKRQKDNDFFERMANILLFEEGNRLLFRELLDIDLKSVDVNRAPNTEGLLEQKIESLNPIHSWWLSSLQEGTILNLDFGDDAWPRTVGREQLRDAFLTYAKSRGIRSWLPDAAVFGRHLLQTAPGIESKRVGAAGSRARSYLIPELEVCRSQFDEFIGHTIKWEYVGVDNVIDAVNIFS